MFQSVINFGTTERDDIKMISINEGRLKAKLFVIQDRTDSNFILKNLSSRANIGILTENGGRYIVVPGGIIEIKLNDIMMFPGPNVFKIQNSMPITSIEDDE